MSNDQICFRCRVTLATAWPAFAVQEYYVALDTSLNQCRVMSTPPDGSTMKRIGDQSYTTMEEAEQAKARLPECNT
ncbi:MAG: hypothetical protein ACR2J1_02830 [Methyloceanibacter sp.]|uniref:hypothetical protein n=1 Tax=Methyloceanibacter sp. TaxID=1965321 RepID=UPI003D9AD5BF